MGFLLRERDRLLLGGTMLWLVGAMLGEGVVLAGAGFTAAALTLYVERSDPRTHRVGVALLLAHGALSILSSSWAVRPLRSGAPWSALHWALFPLAMLALRRLPSERRGVLLVTFAVMAVLNAVVAVVQHFAPVFDRPIFETVFSVGRVLEPADGGGYKAGGLHFHRLRYAHTLVPLLLVVVPEMVHRGRRALGAVVVLTSLIGLWFTYTHASWLALAVGLLCFVAASKLDKRWLVALAATSSVLIPLLAAAGLTYPADRSFAWNTAIQLWRGHPILGVGYGGYTTAALALLSGPNEAWPLLHTDAHSFLLQLAAEQGLAGLVLWVTMAAVFVRWRASPPTARQCALFGALAILGIVHNWAFHPVVVASAACAYAFGDHHLDTD